MSSINKLNDQLRKSFSTDHGRVMLTHGVGRLDPKVRHRIYRAVKDFDAFTEDNDPHGERDFGNLEVEGQRIFWKIDYYDPSLSRHSDDQADPEVTVRVMTVMLAEEY